MKKNIKFRYHKPQRYFQKAIYYEIKCYIKVNQTFMIYLANLLK